MYVYTYTTILLQEYISAGWLCYTMVARPMAVTVCSKQSQNCTLKEYMCDQCVCVRAHDYEHTVKYLSGFALEMSNHCSTQEKLLYYKHPWDHIKCPD